jgi:hypothetical protein
MDAIVLRMTGRREMLLSLRQAVTEALEEQGLDVIESTLPKPYGHPFEAVFITAVKPDYPPVEMEDVSG